MLLTSEERERFASYLENEARVDQGLVAQMEKLNVPEVMIRARKAEIAAAIIIAKKLRSIQSEKIGG